MNYFTFLIISLLWGMGYCKENNVGSLINATISGAKTAAAATANEVGDLINKIPFVQGKIFPNCTEPPKECPNRNVTFWYYTRETASTPLKLDVSNPASLENLPKGKKLWHVIVHGYTKSKDEIPNPELRSAFFKKGDYQLISVDYEPLARSPCYLQAVHNVPLIAKCTARMIDTLMNAGIFEAKDLHLIGFSLGAHIVGTVHKYLENKRPSRVTGLDPASPLFDGVINDKLSTESGDFVDVLHTNALMKGKLENIGHIDFYVNGGFVQPGCIASDNKTYSTCNHDRSPIYFAESINSQDAFWGIPCESSISFYAGKCDTTPDKLIRMGESISSSTRGKYFLQTNSRPPFGLGKVARVNTS